MYLIRFGSRPNVTIPASMYFLASSGLFNVSKTMNPSLVSSAHELTPFWPRK